MISSKITIFFINEEINLNYSQENDYIVILRFSIISLKLKKVI